MEFEQDENGLIPLSNAVSWVYAEITGTRLPPSTGPVVEGLLGVNHLVRSASIILAGVTGSPIDVL
jgi:hypothetical protein